MHNGGGRGGYEPRSNYGSYNNNRDSSRGEGYSANKDSSNSGFRIPAHKMVYDGKRMRKAITRRTIDFNASVIRGLQVNNLNLLFFMSILLFLLGKNAFREEFKGNYSYHNPTTSRFHC